MRKGKNIAEKINLTNRLFLRNRNSLTSHFDSFSATLAFDEFTIGSDSQRLGKESNQRGYFQTKLCDHTRRHSVCRLL